jgi:sterol desaturase/sphingolipid hydroxylase (fatty acid hydroxylase superfamily)
VHRWSHEVPFLWRFHSIHHSIETMDWVSAFRNRLVDGLIIAPAVAFMIATGFSLEATGILTVIQIVAGIFLHANVRWRWRPLHRLTITPDFHHWHHANEPDATNFNYSVFLPAWDMFFGTWFMPKDRRPQVYGVEEFIPDTIAAQMTYPFRGLKNPVWMVRHPLRGFRYGFREIRSGLGQLRESARRPHRPFHTPPSLPITASNIGSLDSVTTG